MDANEDLLRYNARIRRGDRLRTIAHRPRQAIAAYHAAYVQSGPRDTYCLQQMGVCHNMLHEYETAESILHDALEAAEPGSAEAGNIERDLAAALGGLGRHDEAFAAIRHALELLPAAYHPAAHAATIGFRARLHVRRGRLREALADFAEADAGLRAANAPAMRLYNLLAWASALSRASQTTEARRVITLAESLIPEHGSRQHALRAWLIRYGGWRADVTLSKLRDTATWLRHCLRR